MAVRPAVVNDPDPGHDGRTIAAMLANVRNLTAVRAAPSWLGIGLLSAAMIALGTLAIALLERATEIPDASAVYLVAVVVVASIGGTVPAVLTAVASFLVYDLLFTEPRLSLAVTDTNELLNLVLVLIVALAVGRLAALGRERASEADRRAVEATGLFAVSRLLATADTTDVVAGSIVERLARDSGLVRVWIVLNGGAGDRVLADTGAGPVPTATIVTTLVRMPGDDPARWVRAHEAQPPGTTRRVPTDGELIRIRIQTAADDFGSLWAMKPIGSPPPGREVTRLLSLAADQLALGLRRDRLRVEATAAEIARRSDAVKSALLDSVSHDLRTPLASIRATAGNLADPEVAWSTDDVRRAAETIDVEAQRLDRFVRSVLDLSRIESGALQPDLEVFDLPELLERTVSRLRPILGERAIAIDLEPGLPLVRVDAVFFDAIVANILDNIADHTAPGTPLAIHAEPTSPGLVRLTIEDGGPGVASSDLDRIFDKFGRTGRPDQDARRGMGVGLSIVRGMVTTLGGSAVARRSQLGGLAIDLELPAAPEPPAETSFE
jgi:two-component system sensor histidine kinase KdpD